MDNYIVIKNGLVLTLDRNSRSGYFNIIIRNNKIFLIDYENSFNEREFVKKNPEAIIIDAKDKLVMPGFFNSKFDSSHSLNKVFFRKCNYENISSWLSLKLIDNFLSKKANDNIFKDLLDICYTAALQNGELFINESSSCIRKEFFDKMFINPESIKQYFNLTAFDYSIVSGERSYVSPGLKIDDEMNNYSLSSLKKTLPGYNMKILIEASLSLKMLASVKEDFGKSFINVLSDMDLISANSIISNPNHLNSVELEILKKRKSTILISASDYLNLSTGKIELDELILSGLNIITGTGYTGINILGELKILYSMLSSGVMSYEALIRTATVNPSLVFGISNLTGTIETNKSADFIFFNIGTLRNFPFIPEPESESICEFIIQNLTSKDITDVILKGEILIKNSDSVFTYTDDADEKAKEISAKLYSEGKYFDFKEKYLMRRRVDRLGIEASDESEKIPKQEIFVDMTETGEYDGEGEFTILGAKEEEFEKPREKGTTEPKIKLKEITSLETGLNLFDEETEIQEIKPVERKTANETVLISDKLIQEKVFESETTDNNDEKNSGEAIVKKVANPEFGKVKLKFGFKDEE